MLYYIMMKGGLWGTDVKRGIGRTDWKDGLDLDRGIIFGCLVFSLVYGVFCFVLRAYVLYNRLCSGGEL